MPKVLIELLYNVYSEVLRMKPVFEKVIGLE